MQSLPRPLSQAVTWLQNVFRQRAVKIDTANPGARRASVLMPLCWHEDQVQVLFTKRTEKLDHHSGQISFPGGGQETGDLTPAHTALRETFEEIGVPFSNMRILLRLDQISTMTGFLITPYLGVIHPAINFNINHDEVERIIMAPLCKVADRSNYRPTAISWQGQTAYWPALDHHGDIIWGATAKILFGFVEALESAQK
jgi:8-oxo-dGTP pyrophosphatase MutT (NUDIX family)